MKEEYSIFDKSPVPDWLYFSLPFLAIIIGILFYFFTDKNIFTTSLASISITYGIVVLFIRFLHYLRKDQFNKKVFR